MSGDGIDFSNMTDEDWSSIMNGLNTPGLDLSQFGMGDRGLGTTDPSASDGTGTLSPEQIALLGLNGSTGFNAPGLPPGGAGVPAAGGGLGGILKALGLGGGPGGDMNWPMLLSLLGAGVGGFMNKSATSKATDQVLQSIKDANTQVTGILGPGGGAQQSLQPYLSGGAAAMNAAPGMVYKPAGSAFTSPVNARVNLPPVSLAAIMKKGR